MISLANRFTISGGIKIKIQLVLRRDIKRKLYLLNEVFPGWTKWSRRAQHNPNVTEGGKQRASERLAADMEE